MLRLLYLIQIQSEMTSKKNGKKTLPFLQFEIQLFIKPLKHKVRKNGKRLCNVYYANESVSLVISNQSKGYQKVVQLLGMLGKTKAATAGVL